MTKLGRAGKWLSAITMGPDLEIGHDWRLLLCNDADFDRVDAECAASDAILVGANTIRRDNPRLLVRSGAQTPGAHPIASADELRSDAFESDEELEVSSRL